MTRICAVDWEKVPAISCIICSSPRTGSGLLSNGLGDSGLAGRPAEYFGPTEEPGFAEKWGLPARYSLSDYLRSMARAAMTENGVTGVKLFVPYLSHLIQRARAEFGIAFSENCLIEKCFPNPRFIFLRREDRIRQAISFMRAMRTMEFERGTACPVTSGAPGTALGLSMKKIGSYVETFARQDVQWRKFFERNHIVAYEIVYENLVAEYQPTVFGALESLGISPPPGLVLPSPRTARQSDDLTEKTVARYAEYLTRVQAGAAD